MDRFTDIEYGRGSDGLYDLVIDEANGDFSVLDGLESAFMVSFFSDRRAREDEVPDPMKRRGWIGDLVSLVPGDRHGSGIWLYEQRRLTQDVAVGIRLEAEAAVQWMVEEGLVRAVSASVVTHPATRAIDLMVSVGTPDGGTTQRAYDLADKTIRRQVARTF